MVYNILQFDGIESNALLTLLAAYLAADYSSLSSERKGQFLLLELRTAVKGVEQGLYLCRSGSFAIGVPSTHHLLWVCFMYYLLPVCFMW